MRCNARVKSSWYIGYMPMKASEVTAGRPGRAGLTPEVASQRLHVPLEHFPGLREFSEVEASLARTIVRQDLDREVPDGERDRLGPTPGSRILFQVRVLTSA